MLTQACRATTPPAHSGAPAEGFSVTPAGGTMQWAVSQAAPFRRMHIYGNLVLHQNHGWASGGWMSDSVIDGNVDSGSQQQWIARNSQWGSWTGSNWNMVFVGDVSPPAGEWPSPPYTKVASVPVVREKPFLFVDARGNYLVRVPALRHDSSGITWRARQYSRPLHPTRQLFHRAPRRHGCRNQRAARVWQKSPLHSRHL